MNEDMASLDANLNYSQLLVECRAIALQDAKSQKTASNVADSLLLERGRRRGQVASC